jgi:DNA-directed RNA polymerase
LYCFLNEVMPMAQLEPKTELAILEAIFAEGPEITSPVTFTPALGEPVPDGTALYQLPESATAKVAEAAGWRFTRTHDQVILVDPATTRVVNIIRKQPPVSVLKYRVIRYFLSTQEGFGAHFKPFMDEIAKRAGKRRGRNGRIKNLIGQLSPGVIAFLTFRSMVGLFAGAADREKRVTVPVAAKAIARPLEREAIAHARYREGKEVESWDPEERIKLGLDILYLLTRSTKVFELQMVSRATLAAHDSADRDGENEQRETDLEEEEEEETEEAVELEGATGEPAGDPKPEPDPAEQGTMVKIVRPTKEFSACVRRQKKYLEELTAPAHPPLPTLPVPWVSCTGGGYPGNPPLKLLKRKVENRFTRSFDKALDQMDLSAVFEALNTLQSTKWRIDQKVLDFITSEKPAQWYGDRDDAKISISRDWQWVKSLSKAGSFHFAYQLDYRGRAYPLGNWLNPQGDDLARALLQFAEAKPIDSEDAKRWLAIHGANLMKKPPQARSLTLKERVALVNKNSKTICDAATDPLKHLEWLDLADKDHVYRFLAFCFEWRAHKEAEKAKTVFHSRIPVGMDGSCNGYQHFAALLQNKKLAAWANVTASDIPGDIYTVVADWVRGEIDKDKRTSISAIKQLAADINKRELAKKVVMTIPYGSTRFGIKGRIRSYILKYAKDNNLGSQLNNRKPEALQRLNKLSGYLTKQYMLAIKARLSVAWEIREWLRQCAGMVASRGIPMIWISPIGLPVFQAAFVMRSEPIQSLTAGKARIKCMLLDATETVRTAKQMSGASPNFVHALDASHMMMTAIAARREGISALRMVHDCYATHAADAEKLNVVLRDQFFKLYTKHNILEEHFRWVTSILTEKVSYNYPNAIGLLVGNWLKNATAPLPPKQGALKLDGVKESVYFFS